MSKTAEENKNEDLKISKSPTHNKRVIINS